MLIVIVINVLLHLKAIVDNSFTTLPKRLLHETAGRTVNICPKAELSTAYAGTDGVLSSVASSFIIDPLFLTKAFGQCFATDFHDVTRRRAKQSLLNRPFSYHIERHGAVVHFRRVAIEDSLHLLAEISHS